MPKRCPGGNCELDQLFAELWGNILGSDSAIEQVVISNVAGDAMAQAITGWLASQSAPAPYFAKSEARSGDLICAYPKPEQLGVDRWVAVQAGASLADGAVLVIDCGTATTVDMVTSDHVHRGGAILPGIGTMRRALAGDTADLDVPDGEPVAFADNTRNAIAGGTVYALCGAIERLAEEAKDNFQETPSCLITGGEAEQIRHLLKISTDFYPELVLLGLQVIACREFS